MNDALVPIGTQRELAVTRPAAEVLEEARQAAVVLKDVIDKKPKRVTFNGEQYLEFEDWQTVGRFYGIAAKVVSADFVDFGGVKGFRATAEAVRADGAVLSSATAACLNDEEKWRSKPKYDRQIKMQDGAWVTEPIDESARPKATWVWNDSPRRPESRRVKVGDEPVPLFQVMSMAETRACSKVLRQVLAWVVVLAGYKPTPAEELDTETVHAERSVPPASVKDGHVIEEQKKPAPTAQPTATLAPGVTTVKSVKVTTGTNKKGEWTKYFVVFDDGRSGSTFSDTHGREFQAAEKATPKTPVNPILAQTEDGKYWNITGINPVVAAPAAAAPKPPDEPVAGPEKILTVREAKTAQGPYWIIQTDKRELVTDQEPLKADALAARKMDVGLVPEFVVIQTGHGPKNRLVKWVAEAVEMADADLEALGEAVGQQIREREAGEEG